MGKAITGPPPPGNVVRELRIGNTLIQVCDDACRNRTQEDVRHILDRCAEIAGRARRAAQTGQEAGRAA